MNLLLIAIELGVGGWGLRGLMRVQNEQNTQQWSSEFCDGNMGNSKSKWTTSIRLLIINTIHR
jgi:hypothetical protein